MVNKSGGRNSARLPARSRLLPTLAGLLLITSACSSDCLPAPEGDNSTPEVRIAVEYRPAPGAAIERREIAGADSSITLRADKHSPVQIRYVAADSTGMRRLVPGFTVQKTVGIGMERRHVEIDPVEASCPTVRLEREHEVYGTGEERVVIITAAAENWQGLRSAIEPISIRLE